MDLFAQITTADADHISDVIYATMQRYRELFPDWDICFFSFQKCGSRNEQIDMQISFLQRLKEYDADEP